MAKVLYAVRMVLFPLKQWELSSLLIMPRHGQPARVSYAVDVAQYASTEHYEVLRSVNATDFGLQHLVLQRNFHFKF